MLGHKTSLSKFKKIEIISSIFSDHNTRRPEINYKKKLQKHKHVEAKQYATKKPMDHWRNQRGNFKIPGDKWKWKTMTQNLWDTAKAVLREKFMAIQAYLRKWEKAQTT